MKPILARHRQPTIENQMDLIYAPISLGELIDKISILHIKSMKLSGEQLVNVKKELNCLEMILVELGLPSTMSELEDLGKINK